MAKLDTLEKLKYIEEKYPVESIEYKGVKIWPFIRSALFDSYYFSDENSTSSPIVGGGKLKRVYYALKNTSISLFFKRNAGIIFTDDIGMKKCDGVYIDRIMQGVFNDEENILPIVIKMYANEVSSVTKYIQSDCISIFIKFISYFLPIKKCKIVAGDVLSDIISELNISFDCSNYLKTINAALTFYYFWFLIIKPKKIYVNCYYDILRMPSFFIAKKKNIPVIEMQHGSITAEPAYKASKYIPDHPYPDYLFVFGERFKLGVSENIYPRSSVFSVGSYYINLMLQSKEKNAELFNKKYVDIKDKIIITVASQYDIDKEVLDFIVEAANIDTNLLFIFIPRFVKDYHEKFKHECVSIETELDVYQCMQNSHITSAVVSTCAVESLAFGTPVVMMDIKGLASFNYKEFFSDIYSVFYADTPQEYIGLVYRALKLDRNSVQQEGNLFFADNYDQRLKDAMSAIELKYKNK